VTNNSGEDYENAQTRLIVGKVHILDQIAELARRDYPYGRPTAPVLGDYFGRQGRAVKQDMEELEVRFALTPTSPPALGKAKAIVKEGLSEYFLYTIEGTETIPNGWSKRLKSFDVDDVPVVNLYKYEQERYGPSVVRFLSFKNDEEHNLGETPIPDGTLKVYRGVDEAKHLSYEGQSSFKYIPVDEEVELNLGAVQDVVVEPTLMEFQTSNYRFESDGDIAGWDEVRRFRVEVRNTRDVPVKVEIRRNFDTTYWTLERTGQIDEFEKIDMDTVEFTVSLAPQSRRQFEYTVTTYHGTRTENWTPQTR
jgi:hypothetical protein